MERFESGTEDRVVTRFKEALKNTDLIVQPSDKWQTPLMTRRFDIVIYRGINPLAVVEIKESLDNKNLLARSTDQVRSAIFLTNARFGIATDNHQFYLFDRTNRDIDFYQVSFDDIISRLVNLEKIRILKKDKELVLKIIIQAADKYLGDNLEFQNFIHDASFINKILFDQNSNTFHFPDDQSGITSFENQFFIKMFGQFKATEICRYTSFSTAFEMLKNISFRMNGLVGMNDKSEVNYVENYFNKKSNQISLTKPLSKEHYNTIIALNNRYITSCSTIGRRDDLTLWRLYSDDAKGVCLVFDVKGKNLNKHIILQKVKYADENGDHKELDFLQEIKDKVDDLTVNYSPSLDNLLTKLS